MKPLFFGLALSTVALAVEHTAVLMGPSGQAYFASDATNTATQITGLYIGVGAGDGTYQIPPAIDGNYAILAGSDASRQVPIVQFANALTNSASPMIAGLVALSGSTAQVIRVAISGSNALIFGIDNSNLVQTYFANITTNTASPVSGFSSTFLANAAILTSQFGPPIAMSGNTGLVTGYDSGSFDPLAYFTDLTTNSATLVPGLENFGTTGAGAINSVALVGNTALLGGTDDFNGNAIAQFVNTSTNVVTPITGLENGFVDMVALSEDGNTALLMGRFIGNSSIATATLSNPAATLITIANSAPRGLALNGTIGIAGNSNIYFYDTVNQLLSQTDSTDNGILNQIAPVAISDNVAIIGSNDFDPTIPVSQARFQTTTNVLPLSALVSLIPTDINATPFMAVAITRTPILFTDPLQGTFPALATVQFAFSTLLENHYSLYRQSTSKLGLSALLEDPDSQNQFLCGKSPSKCSPTRSSSSTCWSVAPWGALLGNFSHQNLQSSIPGFNTLSGGAIVGVDFSSSGQLIGGGIAYSYSYVHYKNGNGHSQINQEKGVIYALFNKCNFYVEAAVWGGPYQVRNVQHLSASGFSPTSVSHPNGWLLTPHLELGYDMKGCSWSIEPFVMADWALDFVDSYTENGSGTYKRSFASQFTTLLRTEAGLRFFETVQFCSGRLLFEEKLSYVNQHPTHTGLINAQVSVTPFTAVTVPTTTLNLLAGQFTLWFLPTNTKFPYGNLSYEVETSCSKRYLSQSLMLELGAIF